MAFYRESPLKARLCLITGSGGGLGRILAQKFGELGCTLVLWDIAEKSNDATKNMLETSGFKAYSYSVDLSGRTKFMRWQRGSKMKLATSKY